MSGKACGDHLSSATRGVGYAALCALALLLLCTASRKLLRCLCRLCGHSPARPSFTGDALPLYAHPLSLLASSLSPSPGRSSLPADHLPLRVGETVRLLGSRRADLEEADESCVAPTVVVRAAGSDVSPLPGRSVFVVTAVGHAPSRHRRRLLGGGTPAPCVCCLLATLDGRQVLRACARGAVAGGGWTPIFPSSLLVRTVTPHPPDTSPPPSSPPSTSASAAAAPPPPETPRPSVAAAPPESPARPPLPPPRHRRRPGRRAAALLLLEGLLAWAAVSVEVAPSDASDQLHVCAASPASFAVLVLCRSLSAAVLLAAAEFALSSLPVPEESPSHDGTFVGFRSISSTPHPGGWVEAAQPPRFAIAALAAAVPLGGLALWGLGVASRAGEGALTSDAGLWAASLILSHCVVWPVLLLLTGATWCGDGPRST